MPKTAHRGQALVPVVFVVLILTALAVSLATSARREVHAASNFTAQMQRFYAARGALNYALTALDQTSNHGATYGVVQNTPDTDANGWMPIGDAWVKIEVMDTAGLLNLNTADQATLQRLPILSQQSDLINAILEWRGNNASGASGSTSSQTGMDSTYYQSLPIPYQEKGAPFNTVNELLLVEGVTPQLLYGTAAGAPTDTTLNSQFGMTGASVGGVPNGGAGGYPLTRQAPLSNGQGQTGGSTTPGSGTGNTNQTNPANPNTTNSDTNFDAIFNNSTLPLAEMLTTYVRERNVAADGTARVNINTANAQDLQQKAGLSAAQANAIVNYRSGASGTGTGQTPTTGNNTGGQPGNTTGGPNTGKPGLQMQSGGMLGGTNGGTPGLQSGAGSRLLRRHSRQATVPGLGSGASGGNSSNPGSGGNTGTPGSGNTGTGNTSGTPAQSFKSVADLLQVPGFTPTVMQQVADHLTVDDNPYHDHVVNVNTAPPEVLATVPGMDNTILNAILNYRQNGQAFQTLGDLFTLPNIQPTEFQSVMPYLTTKSSVYRIHIKVRMPGQPSLYAVSALVELTDNGPQIRQWREVPRTPGWASWQTPPTLPTPEYGGTSTNPASAMGNQG